MFQDLLVRSYYNTVVIILRNCFGAIEGWKLLAIAINTQARRCLHSTHLRFPFPSRPAPPPASGTASFPPIRPVLHAQKAPPPRRPLGYLCRRRLRWRTRRPAPSPAGCCTANQRHRLFPIHPPHHVHHAQKAPLPRRLQSYLYRRRLRWRTRRPASGGGSS